MGKSVNQVTLMGRLVRDPELRTTPSGKSVTSFSLAIDKYGKQDGAFYFDITAWDKLGELVEQYTKQGSKVLVLGRLEQQVFEKDGQKRSAVKVVANDISFLDTRANTDASAPTQNDTVHDVSDEPINLDDIPF